MISREDAEAALRQQDWDTAWKYFAALVESEQPTLEWLEAMEAAALPHARAGQLKAQQILGGLAHNRYACGVSRDIEQLRQGLLWIVAALRQEISATGMQLLVENYRIVRASGVRDLKIEEFLSEPEPKAAWQKWTGRDPLSDRRA